MKTSVKIVLIVGVIVILAVWKNWPDSPQSLDPTEETNVKIELYCAEVRNPDDGGSALLYSEKHGLHPAARLDGVEFSKGDHVLVEEGRRFWDPPKVVRLGCENPELKLTPSVPWEQ